jgi:hypothetical protein
MHKLIWLICLSITPVWAQSRLVFAWNANPANTWTWPPCSKLVIKMCRTGYTLTDVTTASAPVVISSTIAKNALNYTLAPLPSAGLHIYSLVINGKGRSGAVVCSDPARIAVHVPPRGSHTRREDDRRAQRGISQARLPAITTAFVSGSP